MFSDPQSAYNLIEKTNYNEIEYRVIQMHSSMQKDKREITEEKKKNN